MRTYSILYIFLFIVLSVDTCQAQTNRAQYIDSAESCAKRMDYQKALSNYKGALVLSKKAKNDHQIVLDYLSVGQSYLNLDDMDMSIENFLLGLRKSEKIEDGDSLQFEALLDLSYAFFKLQDLDQASDYLNRITLIEGIDQQPYYFRYYNILGIIERNKKNFDASINAYKKALEIIPESLRPEKIKYLNNLATAYYYTNDPETSHQYLLKAQKLNELEDDDYMDMVLWGQLGMSYLHLGNNTEARKYFLLTLEKAEASDNKSILLRVNRELARFEYKLGNYKIAYDYYVDFVSELESSHDRENTSAIAEMSAKYEHEKNQQRITYLEKQDELNEQIHENEIERRNLWVLVVALVLIVSFIISIIVFKNQRNKQRLKLELVENQKEVAKQQAELKGQEVERNRLSRELHDGLGGTLSSIKMRLSSKNIEEINPILKDIDAACQDVRNMSHSLSSTFINEIDFYTLLTKLTEDIRVRSALKTNLEFMPADELNKLETERKHQCYRIIQELSNNVIKHAQASKLTIGLMKNESDIILLIEDDGMGFDAASTSDGIGLSNVRKRLEKINGTLDIRSSAKEGTTFSISFPFIETHEN